MLLRPQARLIVPLAKLPKGVRHPRAPFSLGDVEMSSPCRLRSRDSVSVTATIAVDCATTAVLGIHISLSEGASKTCKASGARNQRNVSWRRTPPASIRSISTGPTSRRAMRILHAHSESVWSRAVAYRRHAFRKLSKI